MPTKEPSQFPAAVRVGSARLRGCLRRGILAAILGRALLFGESSPFSLGFLAASGSGAEGAAALCGTILSAALGADPSAALRCSAAAILIYAVSFAFFDLPLAKKNWFMPLSSTLITAVTSFVYLSTLGWNRTAFIHFFSNVLMVGVSCLFFQSAQDDSPRPQRSTLLFLTAALTLCLANLSPITASFAAALITLLSSRAGASAGAVTGGALGLASGLAPYGTPLLSAVLSFSGALTGLAHPKRLGSVLLFGGSALLCVLWVDGGVQMAKAVALAAAIYSLLPERVLRRMDSYTCPPAAPTETEPLPAREPSSARAQFQLEEQAAAFRTLFEHIYESVLRGETPENSAVIFDRVCERVCVNCAQYQLCWRREHVTTCQVLTQVLSAMLDRGTAEQQDFPERFRSRCIHLDRFLLTANEELYRFWNRQQYRARLKNNRLAVCRQYAQLAALLEAAAGRLQEELIPDPSGAAAAVRAVGRLGMEVQCDLHLDARGRRILEVLGKDLTPLNSETGSRLLSQALGVRMEPADVYRVRQGQKLIFRQSPPLAATVAAAASQKEAEHPNGDNGIWFRDENGLFWVVLCDGMGSGGGAARESRLLLTLLKDFLHAGVDPNTALTTLTGALSLRGEVDGGFTTVDLLRVDLFTGAAELFKLGGAPTYLRKGGQVNRVTGSALPAGLEMDRESVPDATRLRLAAEDLILLVTDGITDGEEDRWLRTMLAQYHGESPRELAQMVLSSPGAERRDDRTVVAVRITKRV